MITRLAPRHGIISASFRQFNSQEMAYSEKRLIGFSREQMYSIVSDISQYHQFVPWCRRSTVSQQHVNSQIAELEIGFPPLLEKYTSRVIQVHPSVVHSVCIDDSLFRTLDTTFRFGKGLPNQLDTCILHYDLVFEFKSAVHSRIAHLFFDKVVKTMVGAFLSRAESVYGPPSIQHSQPEILQYRS